jgi:uncharacterized membrane protein YhhN
MSKQDSVNLPDTHTNRLPVFINPNFKIITWLLITSMLAALLYGYLNLYVLDGFNPFLIKMTSILCLATMVHIVETNDRYFNKLLVIALLLHCLGDGVIENFSNLIFAIPFFLFGHIFYSTIFLRDIFYDGLYNFHKTSKVTWWQYGLILLIVILAIQIAAIFLPKITGILFYGVIVYIAVLSFTAILTVMHPSCLSWLGFGVLLYVSSDFLIAYNEFINPIALRLFLSWPLYYFAQLSIAYGLLNYHLNLKFHHVLKYNT